MAEDAALESNLPTNGVSAAPAESNHVAAASPPTLSAPALDTPLTLTNVESFPFLEPPQAADEIGRLSHYRILKKLGQGGMGVVFLAEDLHLQRQVALKVLKPEMAETPTARQRFVQEARATAALQHDHIVNIFEVGQDHEVPFLAMPLLQGETLEARLQRQGRLPLNELLRVGREVAEGLAAAHKRGLIHRDIKPSNIWLEAERDRVKILDFGLARATGSDAQLTHSGMIVGTPAYMAPEQARGETVDPRSDLFSLGCVLYHASTGQFPFKGTDTLALLMALALVDPVSPRELNPDLPQNLSDLIRKLLAKNRADRPPTADAVVKVLAAIERVQSGSVPAGQTAPGALTLKELRDLIRTTDPAAVLVAPRILGRVIHAARKISSQFMQLPHQKSYVIDRHLLFRHVEQEELDLESEQLLPPTVILLARPTVDELNVLGREAALLKYWRRLFHANIHLTLERQLGKDYLAPEEIRARVEQIGPIEFAEIRRVLQQDHYLLPTADDREVYIEFAALYLELRYFLANLRPVYFPAILDFQKIDQVLAQDLDAEALFSRTRLPGAPDPVTRTDTSSDEPNDFYWKLVRSAEKASKAGNTVRAAILRTRAARVAPADLTLGTRVEAQADLQRLTARLQAALKLSDADAAEWLKDLSILMEKADQGHWTVEARMLYDLQKVCVDHERDIYSLDLVEFVLSAGKRPIKRPLPSQRIVRVTKHLRHAAQRLTMARLSDLDRQHLTKLLQTAQHKSEERLRTRFRPVIADALHDVGLQANNPPEFAAFHKMLEELLDRVAEVGFLNFSDLRDAISRNNLKLPDMADPQEFVRGDPLLRLDRRLATLLDGVYRPSEFYLRWLERLTALNFGTEIGRWITRYVTIPFGGAYVLLKGLELMLAEFSIKRDPVSVLSMVSLGVVLFGLLYVPRVQQTGLQVSYVTYRGGRKVFIELPTRLLSYPGLQMVLHSWPVHFLYWYAVKPGLACALIWLWFPEAFSTSFSSVTTFLTAAFLLNSRMGKSLEEIMVQSLVQLYDWLRSGLLQGLFQFILRLFKRIIDTMEYVLYTVDELLRFRSGDSRLSMIARTILGVIWFPVSYLARTFMVVLIEPGLNPIKLPVSIMAAKFMLPFSKQLTQQLADSIEPVVGRVVAYSFAIGLVWLSPDAFGFLFWEMKENWSLYRANRSKNLLPVSIGHHGEKLLQFLKPGFHSGTLPKLFSYLREAERWAYKTGNWRTARGYRHTLHEVETTLRLFVERELVVLLLQSRSWQKDALQVGQIVLASNRISVELHHVDFPGERVRITFEEQHGWLVASLPEAQWLDKLPPEPLRALTTALAGLYKIAGVHLVREQIMACVTAPIISYAITERGLTLRLDPSAGIEVAYEIHDQPIPVKAAAEKVEIVDPLPLIEPRRLIFARLPLTWQHWVETWQLDQDGQGHPLLFGEELTLLPGHGEAKG